MEIKVNVDKQKLKVTTNLKTFVSGTQKFIKFTFNFMDSIWDDLTILAQFRQGNKAYNRYLDENKSVYLPNEIVAGKCFLTLYGTYESIIAITDSLELTIKKNDLMSNIDDSEDIDISEALYVQIMGKIGYDTLKTESQTIIGAINELYDKLESMTGNTNITLTDDGDGNVFLNNATLTDDGDGNITISNM